MIDNRIFVVDDDLGILQLLKDFLEMEGYEVTTASNGKEAISNFKENNYCLAIMDLKLPDIPGTEILKNFKERDSDIEIVMITGYSTTESAIQALRMGAFDYLTKPFNLDEIKLVTKNAINSYKYKTENKRLMNELQIANSKLSKRVEAADKLLKKKHEELKKLTLATMESFVIALETKDLYTAGHSQRVNEYSVKIAKKMKLSAKEILNVDRGAKLHDIGKIFIKDAYLNKPGPLTDEEFFELKKHPTLGAKMIEPFEFLKDAVPLILHHHERVDGKGYPEGLTGDKLSVLEKIVMIADSFDAMSSDRAYRKALPKEVIYKELKRCSGTQFDKDITEVFISLLFEEKYFDESFKDIEI